MTTSGRRVWEVTEGTVRTISVTGGPSMFWTVVDGAMRDGVEGTTRRSNRYDVGVTGERVCGGPYEDGVPETCTSRESDFEKEV